MNCVEIQAFAFAVGKQMHLASYSKVGERTVAVSTAAANPEHKDVSSSLFTIICSQWQHKAYVTEVAVADDLPLNVFCNLARPLRRPRSLHAYQHATAAAYRVMCMHEQPTCA